MNKIKICGARTHNLQNINLVIPRDKLIVISGLSGSGKSSLAFDTLYAEGQRRYVASLSTYTRQFLSLMEKPDIDHIEGLSPAISIEQKSNSYNPRSTVGTMTEIYDYIRLLFAKIGEPYCPDHNIPLTAKTIKQIVDSILIQPEGKYLILLAPVTKKPKGEHNKFLEDLLKQGYTRVRIDGEMCNLLDLLKLEIKENNIIEVVIDRFKVRKNIRQRLIESCENALELSGGTAIILDMDKTETKELFFSTNFACPVCGYSICIMEPNLFSFNNPVGACITCNGLGIQQYFDQNKIIQNPKLSLVDGAINSYNSRNIKYFQIMKSLAEHYKFDIKTPWINLNTELRNNILYGSGKENIALKYTDDYGNISTSYHPFEGIIHSMELQYKETKSSVVREKLAKFISSKPCSSCGGTRLRREARNVFIENIALPTISDMSIRDAIDFFRNLNLSGQKAKIAEKVLKEIDSRLKFLVNVGLNYLTLSRPAETLSGGEAQRVRLASQIGAGLVGVMYILDEPSIGLHQHDNERLLNTLTNLRDLGNTVIVIEHDEDTIRAADHIIDIGPGAGIYGGHVIAEGSLEAITAVPESLTGQYISGRRQINIPKKRILANMKKVLKLTGVHGNNLKDVTLVLPIGLFICITGVSGSGKSTLINDILLPIVQHKLNGTTTIKQFASYRDIHGIEYFNKVINIDQNPICCTSRSNPATYTGIFTQIRELFAGVAEARARGYTLGRFSSNLRGGRCESCQGVGMTRVEMHFLPDVYVLCDQCKGKRYNQETLEIKYKNKTIYEVLDMTIEKARDFFNMVPILAHKLQKLVDVGLTYISLGQCVTTLSGGEVQRVKLARELVKCSTGQTLYILDEPTTGLHFADIQKLLDVLHQLRDQGNTIVVIEHNLNVIKTADWIVDLGPEGGNNGGKILVSGTPEKVAECEISYTARFLKPLLK